MAEITRQRQGQILQAVFKILIEFPDGIPVREVITRAEDLLGLTEFEKSSYPGQPNSRRFDKILRFSTIGAVKAGWLIKTKGTWTVTPEGQKAYETYKDPAVFMLENVRRYNEWHKATQSEHVDIEIVDVDETSRTTTFEEAEESAWNEIAEFLSKMPPYDFQELVAALLRAMGYHVPWVAPRGRDGGVDIVAYTDPIGASGPRIKVQVKRMTSGKVTVEGLRSFLAVLGSQDVGLFVSLGGFTSDAELEVRAQDSRRLLLVDMERLVTMWIEHYSKLREEDKMFLPLRPVYFLAPIE